MPKYVQTDDGLIHELPNYVTDDNYLVEKENFLNQYNQPKPEVSSLETDFIDDEDIERSSLLDIARSGFSREFVQTPAQKDLYKVAPKYANATEELQTLLELPVLNTEQKDRIEELNKQIQGEDKSPEEILQDIAREKKFQKRDPEICVPENQKKIFRETPWGVITYLAYKKKIEFNFKQFAILKKYAKCRQKILLRL